ncbi:MAG: FAD-dependent oxidoreductase [Giesbergeria sp.]
MQRRTFLTQAGAIAAASALPGCTGPAPPLSGGFAGIDMARGHALRDLLAGASLPAPTVQRRTRVLVAGGGIAGLAAARALRLAGVQDFALLELEDSAGGNSRAGAVLGRACPHGAHYLPVPTDNAPEVQAFLEELGLRQRVAGRWRYDEFALCHSPQERLYWQGEWHYGLLPVDGVGPRTLEQYRLFAERIQTLSRATAFAMPTFAGWGEKTAAMPMAIALDAITFDSWLTGAGLDDPHLRWYLNYCCRDDYGAGSAVVSAWAGIHYFASRHGFTAPGEGDAHDESDGVLTWPEGNGFLARKLTEPLVPAHQLHTGHSVLRITEQRHGVQVDALDHASGQVVRWEAEQCVVALPVLLAARVVQNPPEFLRAAAAQLSTAPWVVTNIAINAPLTDHLGAAPAWDNVVYSEATPGGLGYVDAGHQRLDPRAAVNTPTVLTYYQALGDVPDARAQLQQRPWQHWAEAAITGLCVPHPDLRGRVERVEVTRYGHAMAIPRPGGLKILSQIGTKATTDKRLQLSNGERQRLLPTPATARLSFAHADWSGYSVFEEAFTRGHSAGLRAAAA